MQYLRMKSAEQKGPSLLTNESHLRFAIAVPTNCGADQNACVCF